MLSVKYNNTTTCKIDGWLRSTIDRSKSTVEDAALNHSQSEHINAKDSHYNSHGKVKNKFDSGDGKNV
jgi:hypothetical protein